MKFSMSVEKEAAVGIAKNIAGNRIKPALGRSLEKPHLEFGLEC